ncbi:MAG TPA: zinc ribbon domain-containing protein [Anaerolineales bacterium]|nr:zinc ribbon domain-containing protein [Anaerolineales bacterium]
MEQRFLHGDVQPSQLAQALVAEFNRGSLRAQMVQQADGVAVQIATRPDRHAGGNTGITITFQKAPDGVMIRLGQQEWLGTATSLGGTALAALQNPWNLLGRIDDLAQDVENLSLVDHVWSEINRAAKAVGASHELTERLRRVICAYCGTANAIGEGSCIACGAPLGSAQPTTCSNCGYILKAGEPKCPNCGQEIGARPAVGGTSR